jgi:hypothetical protein
MEKTVKDAGEQVLGSNMRRIGENKITLKTCPPEASTSFDPEIINLQRTFVKNHRDGNRYKMSQLRHPLPDGRSHGRGV